RLYGCASVHLVRACKPDPASGHCGLSTARRFERRGERICWHGPLAARADTGACSTCPQGENWAHAGRIRAKSPCFPCFSVRTGSVTYADKRCSGYGAFTNTCRDDVPLRECFAVTTTTSIDSVVNAYVRHR